MKMKYKKQKGMFKDMSNAAIGMGGLGLTMGVAGAVGSQSPVNVNEGLSTMASFTPAIGTMVGAGTTLKQLKRFKKY